MRAKVFRIKNNMKKFLVFLFAISLLAPSFGFKVDQVQAQTTTYKFSVFDQVVVGGGVAKLDVWSWYETRPSGPATLLGSENTGNKGVIQNWPHNGKWLVKWDDGITGWSDEAFLEKAPVGAPSAYKIGDWVKTNTPVNLRTTPTISGAIYKTLGSGTLCNIKKGPTAASGYNWWNVTCNLPGITNVSVFMAEGPWIEIAAPPTANQPPVVTPLGPSTLEAYEGGFWTWTVTDPDGDGYDCNKTKWGDGIEDYEDSHFYVQPGSYTITFSCQDAWGAVGTATATVTVTESTTGVATGGVTTGGKAFFKPIIAGPLTLSPNQDGQWSLSVIASGLSLKFVVDWGDGAKGEYAPDATAQGSTKTATHKYSASGAYSVKFTAIDNATGIKGTVVASVGVLDPAVLARFAAGTKVRTKEAATVLKSNSDGSISTAELGIRPKYAIGAVNDEYVPNFKMSSGPVTFWSGEWWVRVAFPAWKTGWVKASQLEEMCPPLSTAQLSSQSRFVEGECVWILSSVAGNLSVRGSVPVSEYPFYSDPNPIGTVKGGNQGVLISGPTVTDDFVWWQVSWDNGLRGWSAGNWIASERSKPKFDGGLLGGSFTPNSTTTIYFSPQGGRVVGEAVNPNGQIVGRWWANTAGTMGWAEFVAGNWWYKVIYTAPSAPTLRGWSKESDLFGAGTPGNDVVNPAPTCAASYSVNERVQVSVPAGALPFSYSAVPGGQLGADFSMSGRLGTVKSGPQRQNNLCWWQVTYDNSSWPSIWTDARYLAKLSDTGNATSTNPDNQTPGQNPNDVVIAPVSGDVWRVGELRIIKWMLPSTISSIDIQLASGGYIARNYPNTGQYEWIIPNVLGGFSTLGVQQVIYISPAGATNYNQSGVFSILARELKSGYLVMNTETVGVRSTPSDSRFTLGTQYYGAMGTIIDGPQSATDGIYWYVDYQTGADGWVNESYLMRIVL